MMDSAARDAAVAGLLAAYRDRSTIPPLTQTHPGMTLADAYAIQLAQVEALCGAGESITGHKVGLTSVAMQRALGVSEPDYGHLLSSFFHLEHLPIPVGKFLQPRIEPEVAFVLDRPLTGPGVTVADAISAVGYLLPALEIVDSRITDWKITLLDTIADNASSGAVVLGSRPTRLADVDLRLVGVNLYRNASLADTGAMGAVLGSPISSLVWLANTLGRRGIGLAAGHVILPGAACGMVPVGAGDVVSAQFAGIGSVTAVFE